MRRMHLYTTVQILCFALLWLVKMVPQISLSFPFVLLMIGAFRHFGLGKIFDEKEILAVHNLWLLFRIFERF